MIKTRSLGPNNLSDCSFEDSACDWDNDLVLDDQLLWERISTRDVLASEARSENAVFVPVTADSAPGSVAFLKNTAGTVARGQFYCLSFDFAVTDLNIGWLTIWHYWLNQNGQFYNKQVWTNTAESDTGRWRSGQVLIDGEGDWTVC